MDRTVEFNTVAENVRAKQITSKPVKRAPKQQRSQFSLAASKIGKEIYDTSDKLAKLTKLAKRNDLFDDHVVEIEELTFIIKQNIQNLNKEIVVLRESSKTTNQSKQNTVHSDTIVSYLNSKLASTTKGFKDILQVRTETLKTKQDKINKITGGSLSLMSTPAKKQSEHVLYKHHLDTLPDTPPRPGGDVVVLMPQVMMQQQQEDYTTSRASAVENIERTIVELGGIFQQLAALVAEQGDMIQRIDSNIDNSERHVAAGNDALLRVLKNVSSSRMLIVKLFLVLIVFAVIFIVFFV
jgi:syntaxin 5